MQPHTSAAQRLQRVFWMMVFVWLILQLSACSAAIPNATFQPASAATSIPTVILPHPTAAPSPQPVLSEKRQIVLEWPPKIRAKDSTYIVLSLVMNDQGQLTATAETPGGQVNQQPVEIANLYDTYNVVAVARLDLPGMDSWRDEIRQPMRPGIPVVFRWSVRADEEGSYRGVVWLHLEFVPKTGGETERVVLLSRPIQIESVSYLGLPGWAARGLSGMGLLVSTLLGYPFVQPLFERIWAKLRRAKPTDLTG